MNFTEAVRFVIFESIRFLSPPAVAAEWVIVALAVLLMAVLPFRAARWLRVLRDGFRRIAGISRLAIIVCGLLPVAIRLSMLGLAPVPVPSIHDEFSHLLLADTLAHGRLTNPTHAMWVHFESIHIIQQPTYASMYPPAQGVFLAFGQAVFHNPWAGVVISVGLMSAAVCWMMQAWLPPAWAFFGSIIAALKIGVVGFWMNSYMSGAVPAIGGALVVGSAPRLRRPDSRGVHALALGLGAVILMHSRPFEGAILTAAVLAWLAPALLRRFGKSPAHVVRMVLLPAGLALACGVAFTALYCWRVTGSPVRMPYQVNRDTYGWPENLAFLPPKTVTLRHKALQDMYAKEVRQRDIYRTPLGFLNHMNTRIFDSWTFFIGPVLTAPLLFLPWIFRNRRTRPLVLFFVAVAALNLGQLVLYPYHLAPIVPILFAMVALGTRYLYVKLSRRGRHRGLAYALLLPLCVGVVGAMKQQAPELGLPLAYWERAYEIHRDQRAEIEQWLSRRRRKQLVIVRYGRYHSPDQEWVYNAADIDGAKVVWARAIDPVSDARLVEYFADREAWILKADEYPQRVVRYRPSK